MSEVHLEVPDPTAASFRFNEVSSLAPDPAAVTTPPPPLGTLQAFTGTFRGVGFNTIFRPDSPQTPTKLPFQTSGDNVLELNLTEETLSFSPPLGSVPNRGMVQADTFLNGVPYLQVITDVTVPSQPVTIHVEPGLWMIVQRTTDPQEPGTLVRMASIPHGTTITAQGGVSVLPAPVDMQKAIPAIDITPFFPGPPPSPSPFDSQTAATQQTARIPQNLASFIAAGTITQAMLTDPATFIRDHSEKQAVTAATRISVSTTPDQPLFGGGVSSIAFLMGDAKASSPNAQVLKMESTFWIETVEYTIAVPAIAAGSPPRTIAAEAGAAGAPVPDFLIDPPVPVPAPRTIKATATQIQYAQQVMLSFNGLTWPHVSVATLVPSAPVPVPASAWT